MSDDFNNTLRLESTSKDTSKIGPIVLRTNRDNRIELKLNVINNSKDKNNPLEGTITVKKKNRKQDWTDKELSIKDLRVGEYTELKFKAKELRELYDNLHSMYQSFDVSNAGDSGMYVRFDGTSESIERFFNSNLEISFMIYKNLEKQKLIEIVSKLIVDNTADSQAMCDFISAIDLTSEGAVKALIDKLAISDKIQQYFGNIDSESISKLRFKLNISQLEYVRNLINTNMDSSDEGYWQELFKNNKWVLEQLFNVPVCYFHDQVDTGMKDITDRGTNTSDYSFRHQISKEIALVEIKTPETELVSVGSGRYRNGVSKLSGELIAGVSQILKNRQNLFKYSKSGNDDDLFYNTYLPKCVLLIGNYKSIASDEDDKNTFEQFRNCLHGVEIITFDELSQRIDAIISLVSESESAIDVEHGCVEFE